ncbi:hypothetical protein EVJ32_10495 [Exiguobacterium sp. SH5S4]|uniref:hypothetical protein n=1 Tax=Exiguobacterium sp. SH5S4 TaxID=2510961 RepID=UPI001039C8C1|nr:hypothetical protein [Exiguobacterium sp. SH5S4]TCI25382.1 hypothetical protein EVJ32_10495 [Exiguobacterium sp. SH5S4]
MGGGRFSDSKRVKDGSRFKKLSPTASLLREVKDSGGVDAMKEHYFTQGAEFAVNELKMEITALRRDLNLKPNLKKVVDNEF